MQPLPLGARHSRWGIVVLAITSGIVAAIQVGKVPPLIAQLQLDLEMSLVSAGWLASLFNLTGAFLGIFGGAVADKFGPRRVLIAGLGGFATAGFLGALAEHGAWLLVCRTIESIMMLACTVSAPRFIVAAASNQHRNLAMGAWGSFMPIGMAIALICSPVIAATFSWQGVWLTSAGLAFACMIAVGIMTSPRRWQQISDPGETISWRQLGQAVMRSGPLLMGSCFALYALQFFAVATWLPTYLIEKLLFSPHQAGFTTACALFCNALGNLLAAALLHHNVRRFWLLIIAYTLMLFCSLGIFAPLIDVFWKPPLAFAFNFFGGLLPAACLAGTADHAPQPAMIGTVNGVVVQGAAIGSLAGPPAMAVMINGFDGWAGTYWLMVVSCITGLSLATWLGLVEKRLGIY